MPVTTSSSGDVSITVQQPDTTIGRAGENDSDYFEGVIDDVRIYSRALSPTEIQQLYQLGTVRIRQ